MNRFAKLNNDELRGANWALRLLHTSPRVRGEALKLLECLIAESLDEMADAKRGEPVGAKPCTTAARHAKLNWTSSRHVLGARLPQCQYRMLTRASGL